MLMDKRKMMKRAASVVIAILFLVGIHSVTYAQFEVPEIKKVSTEEVRSFDQRFSDINWTGQGLNRKTAIDGLQTEEIRARLQAVFGEPTLKIEDMVSKSNFRLAYAIQFEYRFVVNGEIPFMVLDVFGPFGRGLSYSGPSKYVDLMPQIKRAFANMLMEVEELEEYQDYYYSADRGKWYEVRYANGEFTHEEIKAPEGMSIE